ncbi:MAG: pilus assembly protein TadG-related protein [Aliishimia sp.]
MKRTTFRTYIELVRFYRDESGVATIFACFMIMMMVLVGGIGVDLMHNEMERTRLQHTLDRAVLAAADLDQTLSPDAVVQDYFDKSGMGDYLSSVNVSQGLNYRTVTASATTASQTQFMHLMGVDQLEVPATGAAEERISNVEISLVLDISGSMRNNSRMDNLQDASNTFVTKLIRDETEDLISINIVPYSEHVNIGEDLFNAIPNKNNYFYNPARCLEIPDSNFSDTAFDASITYEQMQYFQWYNGSRFEVDNTSCPRHSYEGITPLSQNLTELKSQIDQLEPRAQTSIFLGVKWGAALLDPSMRSVVSTLRTQNVVDDAFVGRPADFDDHETLKTIVVMTDGKNTSSYRIADWAYDSDNDHIHWTQYNFSRYLNDNVRSSRHSQWEYVKYNSTNGDALTAQICTAAKANGIVIWGVGLEVDDHGAGVLQACASSPSHFFRVEGVEISEAFSAIATQINQLRLTQ